VDRARARAALWEGLAEGGWQSSMAIIPPLTALVAADVVAVVSRVFGAFADAATFGAARGDKGGGDDDDAASSPLQQQQQRQRRQAMQQQHPQQHPQQQQQQQQQKRQRSGILHRLSVFSSALLEGVGRSIFELIETLENGGGLPHW
jgi:hypothetical protein